MYLALSSFVMCASHAVCVSPLWCSHVPPVVLPRVPLVSLLVFLLDHIGGATEDRKNLFRKGGVGQKIASILSANGGGEQKIVLILCTSLCPSSCPARIQREIEVKG